MLTRVFRGLFILLLASQILPIAANCPEKKIDASDPQTDNPHFGMYGQFDGVSFNGDTEDLIYNVDNFHTCFHIPRARFFVTGKQCDLAYQFNYDAAAEEIRDFWVRSEKYKNFWFTIGQFNAPYNASIIMPQSQFNFLEQSLPAYAFARGFRVGMMAQFFTKHTTFTIAGIGPNADNKILGEQIKGHLPLAGVGRITIVPIHEDARVIHLGIAGLFQDTDSTAQFDFRSIPEVQDDHTTSMVDTGSILNCKNYKGLECEGIFILNSLTLSGEYIRTDVNRNPTDLVFQGGSFFVDYFFTGEHYTYNYQEGCIDGISKIRHCYGAWGVTCRYSVLDLNDEDINGGKEVDFTLGINCWLTKHVKFIGNYINADANPSSNGLNRHLNIFGLRCQIFI